MSNHIQIHGNVSQDPEMRVTPKGMNVLTFNVADSYGKDDKKKTTYHSVTVFGQLAENVASSIKRETRCLSLVVSKWTNTRRRTARKASPSKSSLTKWVSLCAGIRCCLTRLMSLLVLSRKPSRRHPSLTTTLSNVVRRMDKDRSESRLVHRTCLLHA